MRAFKILPRDQVGPDTPLRLDLAAALAFPDRSMTGAGLRREAARGRLVIERVAGKIYTTLGAIDRMRELCRVTARPTAAPAMPADQRAHDAALTIVSRLAGRSVAGAF